MLTDKRPPSECSMLDAVQVYAGSAGGACESLWNSMRQTIL
jgi:hypothetical protein